MERKLDSRPNPVTCPGVMGKSQDLSRSPSGSQNVSNHLPGPFMVLTTCDSHHYGSLWAHAYN